MLAQCHVSRLRQKSNFFNPINVICPVQSPFAKIFPFPPTPNQIHNFRHPVPQRGVSGSSETRGGMRWTRQRQA
jgi:hypothetical protein